MYVIQFLNLHPRIRGIVGFLQDRTLIFIIMDMKTLISKKGLRMNTSLTVISNLIYIKGM